MLAISERAVVIADQKTRFEQDFQNGGIHLSDLILYVFFSKSSVMGPVGFEPTTQNQESAENKELTENTNPVFATGFAKIVQKYAELEQIIIAWPQLPEQVKTTIKSIIQSHEKELK